MERILGDVAGVFGSTVLVLFPCQSELPKWNFPVKRTATKLIYLLPSFLPSSWNNVIGEGHYARRQWFFHSVSSIQHFSGEDARWKSVIRFVLVRLVSGCGLVTATVLMILVHVGGELEGKLILERCVHIMTEESLCASMYHTLLIELKLYELVSPPVLSLVWKCG